MRSLLKADFFAVLKSKVSLIVLIICVAVPLFTTLVYVALGAAIDQIMDPEIGFDLSQAFEARFIMFSNFSLTNNIGLVIPVFAGILIMADIRNGTVRNKVIIGKNRTQIYFSHLIVSTVFCVAMSLISFVVLCGGSLLFFKYGAPFKGAEVGNFFMCLCIGLVSFAFIGSLTTFFALVTKSMPITIIFTIIIMIVLGIIGSLYTFMPDDKYKYFFYCLPTFASTTMVASSSINLELFLFGIGSILVFYTINTVLGVYLFNKLDLK